MSKDKQYYIGQMTKEEFYDAIKIILADDSDDKLSLLDKIKKIINNTIDFFKDIITLKFITKLKQTFIDIFKDIIYIFTFKFIKDIKQDLKKFFNDLVYIFTFKFIDDFIKWYRVPLTKEVFIRRGKVFKNTLEDIIETILWLIVMVVFIRFFIGEIRWIPSGSMKPTLMEKDRIVVERYSRFFSGPKRGDIMVFYPPSTQLSNDPISLIKRLTGIFCKDIAYIKRVVGEPGDKIEIKFDDDGAGYVYINDKKYKEDYIKSEYEYPPCADTSLGDFVLYNPQAMKCGPFYLGKDDYFMMGDNRGNSQDSRYWGVLKKDRFIGRATLLWWPVNRFKVLERFK